MCEPDSHARHRQLRWCVIVLIGMAMAATARLHAQQTTGSDEPNPLLVEQAADSDDESNPLLVEQAETEQSEEAQEASTDQQVPMLSLDFAALMTDQRVAGGQLNDPLWSISPAEGRRLILLPIIAEPPAQDTELSSPSISLRGGRFVGWHLSPEDAADADAPAANTSSTVPDDAPRITRKITLHADGTVSWTLDRFIPGGEVSGQSNPYAYKVRPDLLVEQRPQRGAGGGDRRQQQMELQQQQREFRALRDMVRTLPDEFRVQRPERLWAVFDVPESSRDMNLSGPPPLPWRVDFEAFESVQEFAQRGGGGGGQLSPQDLDSIARMSDILRDGHALSQRMVAYAVAQAQLAASAQPNDQLYTLFQKLIAGDDPDARAVTIASLSSVVPPTPATRALLAEAMPEMSTEEKMIAMSGLFRVDPNDRASVGRMVQSANAMLTDEDGPDAGQIVHQVLLGVLEQPDAVATVTTGLNFETLSESRRDQAIAGVIRDAGTYPLAASLLNHKLLGSTNPRTVRRTLELLDEAGTTSAVFGPTVDRMMSALFGEPDEQAATGTLALDLTLSGPIPLDSPRHSLYRSLNSGDPELHDLAWGALRHFVIPDGVAGFDDGYAPAAAAAPEAADDTDQYQLILDTGLAQPVTPKRLARFFANQPDQPRGTVALVGLVAEADDQVSARAARFLRGSGRDISTAMLEVDPELRGRFADRVYLAFDGAQHPVTGLARDPDNPAAAQWFARNLAVGATPPPSAWAGNYQNEDELLTLADSTDSELAAGAVAALVASTGGDDEAAAVLIQRFAEEPDKSLETLRQKWIAEKQAIYAGRLAESSGSYQLILVYGDMGGTPPPQPGMTQPRFHSYVPPDFQPGLMGEGSLDPGMQGYAQGTAPSGRPAPPPQLQTIILGSVELTVEGSNISLSGDIVNLTVPDEYLAIRIATVSELANFNNEALTEIPLDQAQGPLDLFPMPDGSWHGRVDLNDGKSIELRMVLEEAPPTEQ